MIELILDGFRFSVEGEVKGLTIVTPTQRVQISITPLACRPEVSSTASPPVAPCLPLNTSEAVPAVPPILPLHPEPSKGVPAVVSRGRVAAKTRRQTSEEFLANWRVTPRQIIKDIADKHRLTVVKWVEWRVPFLYRAAFYKWWENAAPLPADVQKDLCNLTRFSCWDSFPDEEVVPKFLGRHALRVPMYQRLADNLELTPEVLANFLGIDVSAVYAYRRKYATEAANG